MGAFFRQELIRTSAEMFRRWERHVRCSVVGTSAEARQDFYAIRYAGPTVNMVGDERKGLSDSQRDLFGTLVSIPTRNGIDSLALAVATSVILYEAWSRRNPARWTRSRRRARRGRARATRCR